MTIYRQAEKLMEQGKDFQLVNEHGEQKTFKEGTSIYNTRSLRNCIRIEEGIGYTLKVVELKGEHDEEVFQRLDITSA